MTTNGRNKDIGPDAILEPFQITRKQLNSLFNSPTLVKQIIAADWIKLVRAGKPGREALYDYQSVKRAFERLKNGELPSPSNNERTSGGDH